MNNVVKTASIITSGILVGALVRRFVQNGIKLKRQPILNESVQSVKNIFKESEYREDVNEFFV